MSDLERNRTTFVADTAAAGIYCWSLHRIDDHPRSRDLLSAKYDVADAVDRVVICWRL